MAAAGAKGECPSADELARRFAAHDRECSEVLAQLARRGGLDPRRATRGDAAVLVLLVRDEAAGCVHVWLTKRAEALRTHSGEVSLPGGKAEAGDAGPEDTALREAREEIGVDRAQTRVLGRMLPLISKLGLLVTPVVALVEGAFEPRPNADEVAAAFTAPLDLFLSDDEASYSCREIEWGDGRAMRLHFFRHADHVVWGLTAHILVVAAEVALQRHAAPSIHESVMAAVRARL